MIRWTSTPCQGQGRREKGMVGKGKQGGKKGKESHASKGYGEHAAEKRSCFEGVGVDTAESTDTRQLTAGNKHQKPQGKGKGKAKSKESEVSESENNKHDDGTWTPASLPQSSGSSQVERDQGSWMG